MSATAFSSPCPTPANTSFFKGPAGPGQRILPRRPLLERRPRPAPGQLLLVEPELAKAAVEEALGGLSLEQALVERDRLRRREALDGALSLPPQDDLDALRVAEERSNLLWDRKIDLVAASLLADEYLERARALADPGSSELEAA